MLVLSRNEGESIVAVVPHGDGSTTKIEIQVVKHKGKATRLGITAPREVIVHRQEVYDEIQRERTGQ